MLLKSRIMIAALAVAFGLNMAGCTDSKKKVEEGVAPTAGAPEGEPAAPGADAATSAPGASGNTIYFGFDDYTLNPDAQANLNTLAESLKTNKDSVVMIEGHCDERGSVEYNLALGERRAQSVKNYLVQLGIDGGRVSTISYGEEKPAVEGHSESAWAKNRRSVYNVTVK